jgi:hypothetical protein
VKPSTIVEPKSLKMNILNFLDVMQGNTHEDIWEYLCITYNSSILIGRKWKNALKRSCHAAKRSTYPMEAD